MTSDFSIYVHIPFCAGRCRYCDFYSTVYDGAERAKRYIEAVAAEAKRLAPDFSGREAATVYFGGGTPSVIGGAALCTLLDALCAAFAVNKAAEITLEANPGELGDGLGTLKTLRNAGFNRISFGVQSSDAAELALLGRRHSFKTASGAVYMSRAAGFENLTLDLMYGLPGQGMETWKKSVSDIIALAPEHISCYALTLSENVPLYARAAEQPDDDTQRAMYLYTVSTLARAGYEQYEISNFAKPGFRSRHNSRYWSGGDYIGLGAAAHSFINGVRSANVADMTAYITGAETQTPEVIDEYGAREERLMLALRTAEGLPVSFLDEFCPGHERLTSRYLRLGLAALRGDALRLTPEGLFVSNTIIAELMGILK